MRVEVIQVGQSFQKNQFVEIDQGYTVAQVLQKANVVLAPGEAVGVFGEVKALDHKVSFGERLEIYMPLVSDPKDKRFDKLKASLWQGTKKRK